MLVNRDAVKIKSDLGTIILQLSQYKDSDNHLLTVTQCLEKAIRIFELRGRMVEGQIEMLTTAKNRLLEEPGKLEQAFAAKRITEQQKAESLKNIEASLNEIQLKLDSFKDV